MTFTDRLTQPLVIAPPPHHTNPISEHPTFHKKTIVTAILVMLVCLAYAGVALKSGSEVLKDSLDWIGGGLGIFVMLWFFFRATLARPRCQNCGAKKLNRLPDRHEASGNSWRVFHCPECAEETKIPGLGMD